MITRPELGELVDRSAPDEGRARRAMDEHDRLFATPILVVEQHPAPW